MVQGLEVGAVAIVTGAAGGIGLAVVRALAEEGVAVACWDREGADFDRPMAVCDEAGVVGLAISVDVRDREAVMAASYESASLGRVRYGVNCAGVDNLQPTATMPTSDWTNVLEVNLSGVLFSCLGQYQVMREAGGAIVNVASVSGMIVNRGCDAHVGYSSSKAGVIHLSRCLATEWVEQRVRVNAVSPGYTRTEMTSDNPPELNQLFVDQTPMRRMAEVHEIAQPIMFLLGSGASFVNGINLPVEGGLLSW